MPLRETGYNQFTGRREGPAYTEPEAGIQEGEEDVVPYDLQTPHEAKEGYLHEIANCSDIDQSRDLYFRIISNRKIPIGTPEGDEVRAAFSQLRDERLTTQIETRVNAFIGEVQGARNLDDLRKLYLKMIGDNIVFPFGGAERELAAHAFETQRNVLIEQVNQYIDDLVQKARQAPDLEGIWGVLITTSSDDAIFPISVNPPSLFRVQARERILGQRYRFQAELDQQFNNYRNRINQADGVELDTLQGEIGNNHAFPYDSEEYQKLSGLINKRREQIRFENSPRYQEYKNFLQRIREINNLETLNVLRQVVTERYLESSNEYKAITAIINAKAMVIEHPEILT